MRRLAILIATVALAATSLPVLDAGVASAALPEPVPCPGCYVPPPVTSWQLQLQGRIKETVPATLYDVDLFDTSTATIGRLHAAGRKVTCYFSAGSFEDWRSDAALFPEAVKGLGNGWPGERWLDVRRLDLLGPIMLARLDLCRQKGFDSADPDNVDAFTNVTGFPLTSADQLAYNVFLANAAHARGLSVALKNDMDQAPTLVSYFDWTLNEQCFQFKECATLAPFVNAGKAVMNVEYKGTVRKICPTANALGFNTLKKPKNLKAGRKACR